MVPPVGIIITVSVLVAASLAAYENPHVRAWVQRTRHKIAMGLHSLGDEIGPNPPPNSRSTDISMHEDKSEHAEARRQRARMEIMERGRLNEERRKKRRTTSQSTTTSPSFDTLVDNHGHLKAVEPQPDDTNGTSTAIDTLGGTSDMRQRSGESHTAQPLPSSDSDPILLQAEPQRTSLHLESSPFESRYEREMREAWNIPLSVRGIEIPPSHGSESLLDLTPATDEFPDPDYSIPSGEHLSQSLQQSDYFSAPASDNSHTFGSPSASPFYRSPSRGEARPDNVFDRSGDHTPPAAMTPSLAGSLSDIHASEAEDSSDDLLSEIGDGIRTPGSTWTDVDSTISGDR